MGDQQREHQCATGKVLEGATPPLSAGVRRLLIGFGYQPCSFQFQAFICAAQGGRGRPYPSPTQPVNAGSGEACYVQNFWP
jgi:hypothetical protein